MSLPPAAAFLLAVVTLCVLASALAIEVSSHRKEAEPKDDAIEQTKNHPLHQPNVGPSTNFVPSSCCTHYPTVAAFLSLERSALPTGSAQIAHFQHDSVMHDLPPIF